MDDAAVMAAIAERGLELPPPPQAVAAYIPVVISGTTASVAGQVAIVDGELVYAGRLGYDVNIDEGREAAARCALQGLSALREALGGSLDRLERIVKLDVFVCSEPDFTQQPQVANAASELLVDLLGDAGRHARVAVGVYSLPLGASVEVAMTAAVAAP